MEYEEQYYITPEDLGWVSESEMPKVNIVKDYLQGVINAVYKTGNIFELENCLDEICEQFDLKLPQGNPVICRKSNELSNQLFELGIALSRSQATRI